MYFIFDSQFIVWSKYYRVIRKNLVVMNAVFTLHIYILEKVEWIRERNVPKGGIFQLFLWYN